MPGQDGNLFAPDSGFLGEKVATEDWLDSEDVEKIGKRGNLADKTGMIVGESYTRGTLLKEREVLKRGGLFAPLVEVTRVGSGIRKELFEKADALPYDDKAAAIAIGERFEKHAVDDGKEGGRGSDTEGESKNGGETKGG